MSIYRRKKSNVNIPVLQKQFNDSPIFGKAKTLSLSYVEPDNLEIYTSESLMTYKQLELNKILANHHGGLYENPNNKFEIEEYTNEGFLKKITTYDTKTALGQYTGKKIEIEFIYNNGQIIQEKQTTFDSSENIQTQTVKEYTQSESLIYINKTRIV